MKKFTQSLALTAAVIATSFVSSQAHAWGQTGHRVTGEIAEQYLSASAKEQINILLPNESLAEASTYPDEMRSNPSEYWQKTAGPWHYVTVAEGKKYHEVEHPESGNAYTALVVFSKTLKDKKASYEDRQLALRFIVHIIGDLHQPLHAGNGTDKGGNTRRLEFFWEPSNLHRVWDSGMIDQRQLSYTEWSNWLSSKISKEQAKNWANPDPIVWINESMAIRDTIYPEKDKISYDYVYAHLPTVKKRLQQAGVRVATYLNQVFEK